MYSQFITYLIFFFGSINIIRMAIFMVGSDLYGIHRTLALKKDGLKKVTLPLFTVVIPAHNEENTILRSLESIDRSTYPKELLELVVVDDGSTDSTVSIVNAFLKTHRQLNAKLVSQENAGKAHALNNAMKNHATGELIMCLDADSSIAPEALVNAAAYFRDPKVVALSSNVKIRNTHTLLNLIQYFEYLVCYQMKRAQTFFNIEYIIGGIGSTFRHSTLRQVNYYDTNTITEDIDLTMKFLKLGNKDHRVIYGSDVVTYTESVLSIAGLIRQRYRWKYGRTQTFFKNKEMFFSFDKKHTKLLTWLYLPYAIFSDIAFFFEPFMVSYILYIVIRYHDWLTLLSAFLVVGTYIVFNVIAEDSISLKYRIYLALIAPWMYFFFYMLSFVEYVALIKSYAQLHLIRKSLDGNACGWEHVERANTQDLETARA